MSPPLKSLVKNQKYLSVLEVYHRNDFICLISCDDYGPRVWCDIIYLEDDRKVYFDNNVHDNDKLV